MRRSPRAKMLHSKSAYIFAILCLVAVVCCVGCFCLATFGAEWRDAAERKMWEKVIEKIDWENFPYGDFPWNLLPETFPWESIPWNDLPWDKVNEQMDYQEMPWDDFPMDKLPNDFNYNNLPLEEMPEDFWGNLNWGNVDENFPYDQVPWEDMGEDFWTDFPWEEQPEMFPWFMLPWANIDPEWVPDGVFPEGFYPEAWDHEHVFVFDEWQVVVESTCGAVGKEQNLCMICNKYILRDIPPTGQHTFEDDGLCKVCGMHRIILLSASLDKEYDGTPLFGDCVFDFAYGSADLYAGDRINYDGAVFASCTDIVTVSNVFEFADEVVIVDAEGNDVTSNYVIEFQFGTLKVTQRKLIVRTFDASQPFDPEHPSELRNEQFECIGLLDNHRLADVVFDEGQMNPGIRENKILSYKIVDENGADVTYLYSVIMEFGKLEVFYD